MMKDVSKYLFSRDEKKVNPSYMEDGSEMTKYIEECMVLGLGISGAVNKLTALLAAAKFYNPGSSAIKFIEAERQKRIAEKTAYFKRKRSISPQQSSKRRKVFDSKEVEELEEYFGLKDHQEKPTSKEIQTFLKNCSACRGRNFTSIKNKVHNILKKNLS